MATPTLAAPRTFASPWEAAGALAAVTRRARPLAAVFARRRLDAALRERVMVAVSQANACRGCTLVHSRLALQNGVTRDELDAIGLHELGELDLRSRTAVCYAVALAEGSFGSVPADIAAAASAVLDPGELEAVEALARLMTLANMTASTADAAIRSLRRA